MANSDLILSKLKAKYSDDLTTNAGDNFGDLWRLWSQDEGGVPYLTGAALLAEYGGSGTFDARELAYWTAFNPGTTGIAKFTVDVVNTVDNTVTVTPANDGGYKLTGTGAGAGNDRRIYYLTGSNVTDVEARLTFSVGSGATGLGQTGIVLRGADNGPAVTVWSNIVFSATGNVINGIWQYDGTTLLSTNQLANNTLLYGPDIIRGVGGGGQFIEVETRGEHRAGNALVSFTGFGGFNGQTFTGGAATANKFRIPSNTVGSWTGGNYSFVIMTEPRHLAVRLQGSTLLSKQWLVGTPEPDWADPVRVATNTIPGTLAIGGVPAPASGLAGIVVAHLGNGSFVNIKDFSLVAL